MLALYVSKLFQSWEVTEGRAARFSESSEGGCNLGEKEEKTPNIEAFPRPELNCCGVVEGLRYSDGLIRNMVDWERIPWATLVPD